MRTVDSSRRPHSLAICSYNIHACVGGDGAFRPDRIARVLCEIDASVLALQEVEQHRVGREDLLQYLGRKARMEVISDPTLKRENRDYGNVLMTCLPVNEVGRVDLSMAEREPHGALDVSMDWHGRVVQVIATHLGLKPGERRQQIHQILTRFKTQKSDCSILMGDLNE